MVLIICDEFCGMTLATPGGQIDARRFPNFAAFAAECTWFRNATTMSPSTHEAIPCVLTGRFPKDPSHPPEIYEYPQNIFTLLGHSHEPVVFEHETRLCPPHLRNWPMPQLDFWTQLRDMCIDLAVVELHLMLPHEGPLDLPSLDGRWSNFLNEEDDESHGHPGAFRRAEQFDEFVARMKPSPPAPLPEGEGSKPGLYVAHVMLPHVWYSYFPSGQEYELPLTPAQQGSTNVTHGLIGLQRYTEQWIDDEPAVVQAAQRYLLQVEFLDRLVGRLVKHLKDVGMYDDTLIVLLADHGVSFRPGDRRRIITETNHPDILSIPLFIKAPHQRRGAISDRNVQSADILPTIAGVLGVESPWHFDGVSALDDSQPAPKEKNLAPEESWDKRLTFDAALPEKFDACRQFERLVGRRNDAYDLYACGPYGDMVGRPVEDFAQGEVPDAEAVLVGDVHAHCLTGRLTGPAGAASAGRLGGGHQRPHCRRHANLPLRRPEERLGRAISAGQRRRRRERRGGISDFRRRRATCVVAAKDEAVVHLEFGDSSPLSKAAKGRKAVMNHRTPNYRFTAPNQCFSLRPVRTNDLIASLSSFVPQFS